MRQARLLPLVLGVLLTACGKDGVPRPWPQAPAVALDLKMHVAAGDGGDGEHVELLQPVTVTLDLFRRRDLEVEFAPTVDAADFLATTAVQPEVELGSGRWQRTVLTLRPLRGPGELEIPAFVAKATDGTVEVRTEAHRLVVASVLAGHGGELEAPGAPFPSPPRTLLWLGLGAGAVLLALLLWWWGRRRRPGPGSPDAIAVPAHVTALRALERLRAASRTTPSEVEWFYVEVSNVLRRYLEQRFGLHAPERTTEEFLRELESGDALARERRGELQQFLSQCDLVKFARHRPAEADHLATFELAAGFVERTRADRVRVAPSPTPAPHQEVPA